MSHPSILLLCRLILGQRASKTDQIQKITKNTPSDAFKWLLSDETDADNIIRHFFKACVKTKIRTV